MQIVCSDWEHWPAHTVIILGKSEIQLMLTRAQKQWCLWHYMFVYFTVYLWMHVNVKHLHLVSNYWEIQHWIIKHPSAFPIRSAVMFYMASGAEPCCQIHKGQTFKVTQSNSIHRGWEQPYKNLQLKLWFALVPDCGVVLGLAFSKVIMIDKDGNGMNSGGPCLKMLCLTNRYNLPAKSTIATIISHNN